ncbi:hypothetical protein [Paenibacillus sp. HB172176]|uniref:hypothetical protein n=1 Tax=Paenibacillus sp. HB172176 TaxID=2493690 RepID=UPI00143B095A|nr:hypothetical protein [Paenibacillus sp. HB172176]
MVRSALRTNNPIGLAALECTASCIVSALGIRGLDPRYFLLGYWHITYYDGMLMSVRNMKWIDLLYEYGIRFHLTSGSVYELGSLLDKGNMAIMLSRASKLRFFPKSMLGFESAGFYHSILLYERSMRDGCYQAVDPVAGYAGEILEEELTEASVRPGQFVFCKLDFDPSFIRPVAAQSFRRESAAILAAYRKTAGKAFALFCDDVEASVGWDEMKRKRWAERNMIALSALVRMRSLVWQSYLELDLMTEQEAEEGARNTDEIKRGWLNINLLLAKYGKRGPTAELRDNLLRKLANMRQTELRLLEFLAERGKIAV